MKFLYTKDGYILYIFSFTKVLLKPHKTTDEIFIKVGKYIIHFILYTPEFYLIKNEPKNIERYFISFKLMRVDLIIIEYPWHKYFATKYYE